MKILTDSKNVIIEIANAIETKGDRYHLVEENVDIFKDYPTQDTQGNITHNYITLHTVTVPEYVEVQKYCYNTIDGFYENPDYAEPPKTVEERLDINETSITEVELALADIYEEMINNG